MWQVPVLAMSLTGGLWFGVSKLEDKPLLSVMLLLTAVIGNVTLALVLMRFRYVMSLYLNKLKSAYPEGFVDAGQPDCTKGSFRKFFTVQERVRQLFSLMLYWAAGASFILLSTECYFWYGRYVASDMNKGIDFYERHAAALADGYESVAFEDAYPFLVPVFSGDPLTVLDVGAGTGRDAAWVAERGHEVVAVEPSAAMRRIAKSLHSIERIRWVDAELPSLEATHLVPGTFDVVLMHAMWMHVAPNDRGRALARIFELTGVEGRVFVSLRLGPHDRERGMYPVVNEEFIGLAESTGFSVVYHGEFADLLGRKEVVWKMYELNK